MIKVEVGQVVIVARSLDPAPNSKNLSEMAVTKVGRKWASLGDWLRFDMETGEVDGRWHWGRVFLTVADYEAARLQKRIERQMDDDWRLINRAVGYNRPSHLTPTDIETLLLLLRIEKPKSKAVSG